MEKDSPAPGATGSVESSDPGGRSASPDSKPPGPQDLQPLPVDLLSPQLTWRAVATGVLLAAVLCCCNIYTGLKTGFSFNMAITAALLGYGGWTALRGLLGVRKFGILENNINQTAASAGASVASAGLVAPIPALALLTGQRLPWHWLALWVFSVCMVGIVVAIGLRRQMILVDKLPFAVGIATAETLRELYAKGRQAIRRVVALGAAAVVAAPLELATQFTLPLVGRKLPSVLGADFTLRGMSAKSLTFGLNSTLLMYAIGGLVGTRPCLSMAIGAVLAWGILAPLLIRSGHLPLEVTEPLARMPAEVRLPPEPEGHLRFDHRKGQLTWRGVMTPQQRQHLLDQSDDPLFQEAIGKLYLRSQLEWSVPLADLPAEVSLPESGPVRFDRRRRLLVARQALDRHAWSTLRQNSDDPAFRHALDELYSLFTYTTTRPIQFSEPLSELPQGLNTQAVRVSGIRYDRQRRRLVATERLSQTAVEALTREATDLAQANSSQAAACQELILALKRLEARSNLPLWPSEVSIPPELGEVVSCDPNGQVLRARGVLTEADLHRLEELLPADQPGYFDLRATLRSLADRSRLTRAEPDYRSVVNWLLWPGATLMVVASLVSLAFSWRSILASFRPRRSKPQGHSANTGDLSPATFLLGLAAALLLSVGLQTFLFGIAWWTAVIGVLIAFLLATVAARVSGETNITPVGAMGKVTQLLFGVIAPGRVEPNLMAANVAGGAASQCADLLHDLKCGYLIGASPRRQVTAQVCGAAVGALVGSLVYLILIPNPSEQLMTDQWAAPAVAAWKAVAELFSTGFRAVPQGTPLAMLIAALAATLLTVLEKAVPQRARVLVPSPASLGLAFVIQASTSLTMLAGALAAALLSRLCRDWSRRFLVAICAGVVAGESISGVATALVKILRG